VWLLMHHWWFWLLYAFFVVGGWYGYWRLFSRREYKKIDGKLYVRHGIGKWVNLVEHMKEKHPTEYASLKRGDKS